MSLPDSGGAGPSAGSAAPAQTDAVLRLLDRPLTAADLAAGAESAAQIAETGARATVGVLLFRLDDEAFALPATSLRRITTYTRPVRIPHRTSGVLRGMCNIRGELVLCADLRRLFGLPARADPLEPPEAGSDPRRMVVIGPAGAPWVFEADSLIGVERIDPAAVGPPPMTVEHAIGSFVEGLAEIDGTRVTVLDAARVLAGFTAGIS